MVLPVILTLIGAGLLAVVLLSYLKKEE